jgi:hypothetical protein
MNKNKININILRMLAYLIDTVVFILFIIPLILVIASFAPSNLRDYTYVQYSLFSVIFGGYVAKRLVLDQKIYLFKKFNRLKLKLKKSFWIILSLCLSPEHLAGRLQAERCRNQKRW